MANRILAPDVIAVLNKDYDGSRRPSLTPYIRAANLITTRVVECATAKGVTLSVAEQAEVECWLAAHFYCLSDKTYSSSSRLGASASFMGQTGMRIDFTPYGQAAVALDASGCLAVLASNQRGTASLTWLGKPPSEQVDVWDRD